MAQITSERAQAAFIGFAIGDAYGRELEFLSGIQVRSQRVRIDKDFCTSDETHMAMYTAQAILKSDEFNIDAFGHALGEALINWTQDPRTTRSAPSKNCLVGVQNYLQHRDWRRSGIPHQDGSGSIMRVCPIAIAFSSPRLEQAAEISALITHSHPNALAAAVSCARLLRATLEQQQLTAKMVLEEALLIEKEYTNAPTVAAALRAAVLQSNKQQIDWIDESQIPAGDGGWKAPSALGLALTAALHFQNNPQQAMDKAARINGDSDGVAALTGMFLGAALGFESLPLSWVQSLQDARDIAAFADSLWRRKPQTHWLTDKCAALEKKGARFAVVGTDFLIKVPQTSTAGILALRPMAEELGVGLEVDGGAVVLRFPKSKAPPDFVARYDTQAQKTTAQHKSPQQEPPPQQAKATQESPIYEAEVIDGEEEEIWEAEIIEEPTPSHSYQPPPQQVPPPQQAPPPKEEGGSFRTSSTHPIRVDWVQNMNTSGSMGLTFAPGKQASSAFGRAWKRDLGADLDRLVALYRVDTLFSLVTDEELERFRISDLVDEASKRKITVYRSPIFDTKTPTYPQAEHLVRIALPLLASGKNIVFHCRGGLGRAGTLSACTLVGLGIPPKKAIDQIRASRPDAIENIYQEQFVFDFHQNWKMK